jgi:hypothetical protein
MAAGLTGVAASLPTYPFQRRRFWVDVAATRTQGNETPVADGRDAAGNIFAVAWAEQGPLSAHTTRRLNGVLLLADGGGVARRVSSVAVARGSACLLLELADQPQRVQSSGGDNGDGDEANGLRVLSDGETESVGTGASSVHASCTVVVGQCACPTPVAQVTNALGMARARFPGNAVDVVMQLWPLGMPGRAAHSPAPVSPAEETRAVVFGAGLERSGAIAGTLGAVQAIAASVNGGGGGGGASTSASTPPQQQQLTRWPRLCIVTRGAQQCDDGQRAAVSPAQAAVLGLARVIEAEMPELDCVCVDLDPDLAQEGGGNQHETNLAAEAAALLDEAADYTRE